LAVVILEADAGDKTAHSIGQCRHVTNWLHA